MKEHVRSVQTINDLVIIELTSSVDSVKVIGHVHLIAEMELDVVVYNVRFGMNLEVISMNSLRRDETNELFNRLSLFGEIRMTATRKRY